MATGDSQPILGRLGHFSQRWVFFLLVGVTLIIYTTYSASGILNVTEETIPHTAASTDANTTFPNHLHDYTSLLQGPPTPRFRDNLRGNVRYITSWVVAGWTNDLMAVGNLIYLSIITDRIPVLPLFLPTHIGNDVPPIAFSEIFDVPGMQKSIGKPILEWPQIKDIQSKELEEIGCWNVRPEGPPTERATPRYSAFPEVMGLDISYTKLPSWILVKDPGWENDRYARLWSLAMFSFAETRNENLREPLPSPVKHASIHPDEHVLCFDYLFYTCAQQPFEWEMDFSPLWRFVLQHVHFNARIQSIADEYIRKTLGLQESTLIPPYISIHMRHKDFEKDCNIPLDQCFASMPVIARRVAEVQEELFVKKGLRINHVIMTSDETDPKWWESVREMGWRQVDHSHTRQVYGGWYPTILDATIQSRGHGFVGTEGSTMSTIARRRVETWQDGVSRIVKWKTPDADDH